MQLLTYGIYLLLCFASVTIIMLILPGRKLDVLRNRLRKNMHLSTSASPIDQNELEIIGILDIGKIEYCLSLVIGLLFARWTETQLWMIYDVALSMICRCWFLLNNISYFRFERADSCRCLLSVRGTEFTNAQCVPGYCGLRFMIQTITSTCFLL